MSAQGPLLEPGRNCWRVEHARRVAFLIDGAAYFSAFRAAAARARRSIVIIGWDIDSRTWLVPEGTRDGYPETLGAFIEALVKQSPHLRVHVLDWDFTMLYAADRELLPAYKLVWRTPRRVHFVLDGAHPLGASLHQKVVVIDDALAFVGGLDLTHCRWDTPEHLPEDPRRRHPGGGACPPFHDVQMAVDGDAAAALGELVRERWQLSTGRTLARRARPASDPWPPSLEVDLEDVRVGIARTQAAYEGCLKCCEIKQLHLDAIAAAQRHLYLENQYFSAASIADALLARLVEPHGPEVALVSRSKESGWLEESTMGVLRAQLHRRLREAASEDRYLSLHPHVPGLGEGYLNVHSKLLVMDDDLVTIGSANLSNRSMGLDTECNLVVEARGEERIRRAIRTLRRRLLAEHLGTDPKTVARVEQETGSLLATIERLRGEGRSLRKLEPEFSEELAELLPDAEILDPEEPVDPELLVAAIVPGELRRSAASRLFVPCLVLAGFLALAAAWRWTSLAHQIELERLERLVAALEQAPLAPLAVIGSFLVGGFLAIPVTVMIVTTVLVFGPWLGSTYALSGTLLSAAATFGLGRALGRRTVRRLAGSRLDRISRYVGRQGVLPIFVVRVLPVAPFTVVNLVAGATPIRWRDFLLGTLLGTAPGVVVIVLFTDRVVDAIREPSAESFAVLLGTFAAAIAALIFFGRWLRKRSTRAAKG